VAEARRLAAIPRRPNWRDSNPRWRRRVLAGAWVLVLMPLMDVLNAFRWADRMPAWTVWDRGGTTLNLTFLGGVVPQVYQSLAFCIGVVLLFSKEDGRRKGNLDWTRRWGVLCSYVVFLLSAAGILFLCALVSLGVAAVFQTIPPKYAPPVTSFLVNVSTGYFHYGPIPGKMSGDVQVAFSSVAMMLACIPLFDALRSSASKRGAAILLAPLALFSAMHLAQALIGLSLSVGSSGHYELYFCPQALARQIAELCGSAGRLEVWYAPDSVGVVMVEAAKWSTMFGIAVWLSIAQVAAWRKGKAERD
jgi:hypothetical protein